MSNSKVSTYIAVLSVELHIPYPNSLKSKRKVLKSLKDRIRTKFNVSIAEVADMDKWQKSVLGICMIGNDKRHLDSSIQKVLSFIEEIREAQIIDYQIEVI